MYLLAINWHNVGSQILQLILTLAILVIIHELGHYLTARWFKCRVDKFYLFFDPWFSLFKKKVGDTEYGIGWLPLGGYVKIAGMVDESMDKEQMKQPPQPYEFRSKPAWQRLIIMLAGVTMNILLAFFIYAMVLFKWGETKIDNSSVRNGIYIGNKVVSGWGFKNGDKFVSVNGKPVKYFDDIQDKIINTKNVTVVVDRAGQLVTITLPIKKLGQLARGEKKHLIDLALPPVIGRAIKEKEFDTSYSRLAGLQAYDSIVSVNDTAITYFQDITPLLKNCVNKTASFVVVRNGVQSTIVSKVNGDGRIGLPPLSIKEMDSLNYLKLEIRKYAFFESFPAGVAKTGEKLSNYIDQFKQIVDPSTEGYQAVGGFQRIASVFPVPWDWESFWNITAFLSIMLAFMNLLPIPALDGGHALFTIIEMITGRKPSEKFMEIAQIVGMVLLLALMLYANGNDWFGWGSK